MHLTGLIITSLVSALCGFVPLSLAAPVDNELSDAEYLKALPNWTDDLTAHMPTDPVVLKAWRQYADQFGATTGEGHDVAVSDAPEDYDDGYFTFRSGKPEETDIVNFLNSTVDKRDLERRQREGCWAECGDHDVDVGDYYGVVFALINAPYHIWLNGHWDTRTVSYRSATAMIMQTSSGKSDFNSQAWYRWMHQGVVDCDSHSQNGVRSSIFRPWGGWSLATGLA